MRFWSTGPSLIESGCWIRYSTTISRIPISGSGRALQDSGLPSLAGLAFHHRAANFNYLDAASARRKLTGRWAKAHGSWARFKLKCELPVDLLCASINGLDWEAINTYNIEPYVAPADDGRFKIATP